MNEIRDALSRLVKAAMRAKAMQEHYLKIGIDDQPWFEIWGDILDGIYSLIGEHTDTFDHSATFITMNAPILSNERRTEMLLSEYRKNHPVQPAPHTFEVNKIADMYRKNGGYMYETPEGDWT